MTTVDDLKYPVLCFSRNLIRIKLTVDALTTCSKLALRNGYFENLLVIDSAGVGLRVRGAEKLYGVGLFWGYNIFLNQRIKVRLLIEETPLKISVDEVKRHVFHSFKHRHGWSTRDDFDELRTSIEEACSIPEIIERLISKNPSQSP
jgi:hypothetical protein